MHKHGRLVIYILPLLYLLTACSDSYSTPVESITSTVTPTTHSPTPEADNNSAIPATLTSEISWSTQTPDLPSPVPVISLWIPPYIPAELQQRLVADIEHKTTIQQSTDKDQADIHFQVTDRDVLAQWVYALVAPFPTVIDGVTFEDILTSWSGVGSTSNSSVHLLVDENSLQVFTLLWGEPGNGSVKVLSYDDLLDYAWKNPSTWALIPFDDLEPRWKVLEVNGQSPIHKDFSLDSYPLVVPIGLTGDEEMILKSGIESWALPTSNRDPDKLTTLSLTGVTALVRGTALTMERLGVTYPALDIADILRNSDLTHINNEIPFTQECPFPELYPTTLVFCSRPPYIELLEEIGTDIIELSGDHFADHGPEAMRYTLQLYAERGWEVYGGGEDEESAREPLLIDHNGNHIALLGCNIGCEIKSEISCKALASNDQPGAATCDFEWLDQEIRHLTEQGYSVVSTFQHKEYFTYEPQSDLIRDFGRVAQAGAQIVSGSQAHQPHAMALENDAFIHYGLGNLFFDQYNFCAENACNDGFIDRHVFYANHHISTELITIRFVDMARPRLMTPEERVNFLKMIFAFSGW